jgi:predicted Zn-dependent peptidase
MMRFAQLAALALLAFVAAACTSARPPRAQTHVTPKEINLSVTQLTLPNGLVVMIHEDHASPFVAVRLQYHVGSGQDPAGKSELAHLAEHMMFVSSRHTSVMGHSQLVSDAGGFGVQGETSLDSTDYFETVPKGALAVALWLEAERMAFVRDAMRPDEMAREREVVKNELRQHFEGELNGRLSGYVRQSLFGASHPYGHPPIAASDIDGITMDDLRGFMGRYYRPNNASLVIAGDVRADDVRQLVEKYSADIPSGETIPLLAPSVPRLTGERRVEFESPATLPRVVIAWPLPPMFSRGVLALYVGDHFVTRIPKLEPEVLGIDSTILEGEIASAYMLTVVVKEGHSVKKVMSILDDHLRGLRKGSYTLERPDFNSDLADRMDRIVYALTTPEERALTMTQGYWLSGSPQLPELLLRRYRSLELTDVENAFYQYLDPDARVVVTVHHNDNAPAAGRMVGR